MVDLELLRPAWWVEANELRVGKLMPLQVEELEVDGHATVTAIEPCPALAVGLGSVVTGRFVTRRVDVLVEATIRAADGTRDTITGTPIHPIWSVTPNEWVPLGELSEGELLLGETATAVVEAIAIHERRAPVYNLEIHGEHVYQFGQLGVLVHNSGPGKCGFASAAEEAATPNVHLSKEKLLNSLPEKVKANDLKQTRLVANQQKELQDAIDAAADGAKATARGEALNKLGKDFQLISDDTIKQLEKTITGTVFTPNVSIGKGVGSNIDHVIEYGGKKVLVESKYSISTISERTLNQIKNAYKDNGSIILNIERAPTPKEVDKLKDALGDKIFNKVIITTLNPICTKQP